MQDQDFLLKAQYFRQKVKADLMIVDDEEEQQKIMEKTYMKVKHILEKACKNWYYQNMLKP